MICNLDELISSYGQHAGSIYIGEQPSGDQLIQIIKWNHISFSSYHQVSEWLLTNEHFVTHIMPRASYIQWNDDDNAYDAVRFVLDQHA
jgi:hypothetical protein